MDENGNRLGESSKAAQQAISQVVISRILMASPGMGLSHFIPLQKSCWVLWPRFDKWGSLCAVVWVALFYYTLYWFKTVIKTVWFFTCFYISSKSQKLTFVFFQFIICFSNSTIFNELPGKESIPKGISLTDLFLLAPPLFMTIAVFHVWPTHAQSSHPTAYITPYNRHYRSSALIAGLILCFSSFQRLPWMNAPIQVGLVGFWWVARDVYSGGVLKS